MRTEPRFVRPNDFLNYTGKDLNEILNIDSNLSNRANLFLMQVEDNLLERVDAISFRTTTWDKLTDFQKECLQKAIIIQAQYILRNSDLFTDSGYDPEKGEIMPIEKIQAISICKTSIDYLHNCGLYSHVISNRRRYNNFR